MREAHRVRYPASQPRHFCLWFRVGGLLIAGLSLIGADIKVSELLLPSAVSYRAEGRRYQEVGELFLAASAYRKAIAAYPKYADAYNDLGVVLESLGNLDEAERAYKTALMLNPRLAAAHTNMAIFYEKKGLIQEAANHWGARVQIGPSTDPWARKARGKLIQHKLPVPELPELVSRKRNAQIQIAYQAGLKHQKEKRWPQAAAEFEKVLILDPTHAGAEKHLRQVRAKAQAKDRAREGVIAALRQMWPSRAAAPRPPQRRIVPTAVMPTAPQQRIVPTVRSRPTAPSLSVSTGDAKAIAQEFAREKAKTQSLSARELYERGVTAMRQGKYEDAVVYFQQLLALDPNHSDARQGLRRAQAALEKIKPAGK